MFRFMFPHACVLGSMFSTCFMLSSMCLCAPCHVCVPRPRLCLSCHVLLLPFCRFVFLSWVLAFCLSFLCFGLSVRTQSRPYGLCHRLCPLAHIKWFGSSLSACLCLLVLVSLVLGFATFDTFSKFVVVWLHLTPMRLCSDVTIWEASLNARLLHAYHSLFRSTQCYACHACLCHPLAFYASLHACSHVHA